MLLLLLLFLSTFLQSLFHLLSHQLPEPFILLATTVAGLRFALRFLNLLLPNLGHWPTFGLRILGFTRSVLLVENLNRETSSRISISRHVHLTFDIPLLQCQVLRSWAKLPALKCAPDLSSLLFRLFIRDTVKNMITRRLIGMKRVLRVVVVNWVH